MWFKVCFCDFVNCWCADSRSPLCAHRFRWLKDGELFGSETEGSGTLRGDNSSLDMLEGEYRCYASNSLGTAMTQTVKVNVERESHKGSRCALRFTPADAQMSHDHIKSHTHISESVRLIGATCSARSSQVATATISRRQRCDVTQ